MTERQKVSVKDFLTHIEEHKGWFFLPADRWSLDTQGVVVPYSTDNENHDVGSLIRTLDSDITEDIIDNLNDQMLNPDLDSLLEAFVYYFKNDAFIQIK